MFRLTMLVAIVLCGSWSVSWAEDVRHRFLLVGPTFTGIIDEQGKEEWDTGRAGGRDGFVLENGNVLIAWNNEVRELTPEKKEVFRYLKSDENKELGTVQRLENGNTLITELGLKPQLLEVDADGKVVIRVPLVPETQNAHMQTRMARKLPSGNYLVPHLLAFAVKEYAPDGQVVRVIKTDLAELGGRAAETWPFTAIRLDNGGTLVTLTHGNQVVEFDAEGNIAWRLSNDDLPGEPLADPCGAQRLANGNTVIASYAAKRDAIKVFEVTPEKDIVWRYAGPHRVHELQVLSTNGTPLAQPPLK